LLPNFGDNFTTLPTSHQARCYTTFRIKIHFFADIQQIWQKMDEILTKSLYLKGHTAKTLTDEFPQKIWTKRGVNKQLKKLRDTGTVDRRPGSGTPRSACTEENAETVNDQSL